MANGIIGRSVGGGDKLKPATTSTLGGIIVGDKLTVTTAGKVDHATLGTAGSYGEAADRTLKYGDDATNGKFKVNYVTTDATGHVTTAVKTLTMPATPKLVMAAAATGTTNAAATNKVFLNTIADGVVRGTLTVANESASYGAAVATTGKDMSVVKSDAAGNLSLNFHDTVAIVDLPKFGAAGQQDVAITGVTADSYPTVDVLIENAADREDLLDAFSHIYKGVTSAGKITFYSDDATDFALKLIVKGF